MRYLLLLLTLCCFACPDASEEFKRTCPYEPIHAGHFLHVPVTITPHQITYRVGDTLRVSTVFPDSIYDLSTERTFKISNFPFKPFSLLYRFYDGMNWDAGYRVNELRIADEYEHVYNYSTEYADHFRAYTIYENESYRFEMEVVLREPGRYIMVFTDIYQNHTAGGSSELNAEADAITFEGKCPDFDYYICSIIEGDNQVDHFEEEMIHVDKEITNDNFATVAHNDPFNVYGSGNIGIEWSGVYGFEVVE